MSVYSDLILLKTPATYWRLGEATAGGAGAMIDATGNGHDGTYSGGLTFSQPSLLAAEPSSCVLFDGTSGFGDSGVSGVATMTGDWTMEAWVYPTAFGGVVHRGIIGTSGGGGYALIVKVGTARLLITHTNVADASATSLTDIPLNAVSHVAATFVDATDTITYYLNGQADGTATLTTSPTIRSSAIGSRTTSDHFFAGKIDEVAIYQSVQSQVSLLENCTVGRGAGWAFAPAPVLAGP